MSRLYGIRVNFRRAAGSATSPIRWRPRPAFRPVGRFPDATGPPTIG
jgi:hypothetical protein